MLSGVRWGVCFVIVVDVCEVEVKKRVDELFFVERVICGLCCYVL